MLVAIPPEVANDPLTSIDRFATLFRLSGSPGDGVVATLQKEGLTTLLVLLETSGLLNYLISGENGPYILLAPSEAAFSRLTRRDLRLLSRGSDLAYHLIPLRGQPAPEVINDSTFVTSLGPELRFNVYEGAVFVNGAPVSRGDLPFTHGTIQVVESVLDVPVGDIKAVLVSSGPAFSRFNTLLSTLNLSLPDSITIFVPPDSAITSKGYSWPELLKDKDQARDLVLRHIIKGAWYTEGLLKERTLTTLARTSFTFRKDVEGSISANGVPLISQNLTASNGVVHLAADVLPELDVGTDPTTIPNPLLVQTEATPFPDPFSPSFDVPQPPVISGLYETPDPSSFADFSPWDESSSDEEVEVFLGPFSEAPSFEEYMMKWRSSNKVPHSKVQGKTPHDNTREALRGEIGKDVSRTHEQFPEEPQIQSHQSPDQKLINQPQNQQLIDFFALLDQNEQAPFESGIALPQIPISSQHSDLTIPSSLPSLTGLSQTFGSGSPPQIPSLSELPGLTQLSTLAHLTNPSQVENNNAPVNFFTAFGGPIEDTNVGEADIENTILDTAMGGDNNYPPTGAPHQTNDRSCIHNHIHHVTGAVNQDHHKLTNEDNLGKVNQPGIPTPTVPPTVPPTAFRHHEGLVSSPLLSFPPSDASLPSSLPSSSLPTSFPSPPSSLPSVPPSSSFSTSFPSPPSSFPSSIPSSLPPPPASLPSSIPVVPGGVEVWRPEGGVEVEAVDVLSLLDRLNLTKFRDLVDLAGLTLTLNLDGPWTVFAPTNAALDSIPHEALDQILAHRGFLRRLVSYHVAPGLWLSPQSFTPGARLPTLHAGYTLRLNYYVDGPVAQRWVAGGSVLTNLDEEATNGVVHVIDRVLYAPYGDLLTTLALSPLLTTVTSVVARDPELLELLSGPGPLTCFVPTDDSLANTDLPQDLSALREWVLSHIVEGSWYTVGFSPSWPFTSITNLTITPQLSPQLDRVTVNDVLVTFADITASNGVIHVLQSPLITPT